MSSRRLVIAAEAAADTGVGHFVRCTALGDAAARAGWDVSVLLRPDAIDWAHEQARQRGWSAHTTVWTPEAVIGHVTTLGEGAVLVVDSYRVDTAWMSAVRGRVPRLVLVDDVADRFLDVDLVVNQNLGAQELDTRLGEGTELLAGPSYALLRPDFTGRREQALAALDALPDVPRRVLVMMGGTDPSGSALRVARVAAQSYPHAQVDVVVPGRTSAHREGRVTELPRVDDVAERMLAADLVVTAAGSTVWELSCLARPVAALEVADNQTDVYRRLVAQDLVIGLGRLPVDEAAIGAALRSVTDRAGGLRGLAAGLSSLVDGRGALRVLDHAGQPNVRSAHP